MLNEFIGILLGACMYFVPEEYQAIVLSISTPIFVLAVEIFTFWLVAWYTRAMFSFLIGKRGRKE